MRWSRQIGILVFAIVAVGCVWHWNWNPEEPSRLATSAEIEELLRVATNAVVQADNAAGLQTAISAYENVLTADPENYQALTLAGNLHILMGDAYSSSKRDKRLHFRRAIALNEEAMRTNREFRLLVEGGEDVWEACRVLTARELDAMGFWTTGVFYLFKEGQNPIEQILNFRWMERALLVLERMQEIDPRWGEGAISFSLGIYYLGLPESVGGDREKSAQYFAEAIAMAPNRIVNRWGRARYFHIKMGNREAFIEDMHWVLEQDPRTGGSLYPWNVYFKNDARTKLAQVDELF